MKNAYVVSFLIFAHTASLLLFTSELSISYYEADIFFNKNNVLHYLINFFISLFGQNDFSLRFGMILIHAIGAFLYYDISKFLFKKSSDQVWNLFIYLLLPGVNSAAIMVDGAGVVLFLLLVFLFFYKHKRNYAYALLPIYAFIDASFAFLYLSLIFYAIERRKTILLFSAVLLFGASMYLFGIDIGGHPDNHFLNTLAIYAAIFSPIIFIYLIYSLYRTSVKEERSLIWYLGATAFLFSLLLSFRQQMKLQELAPYILMTTPIMVKTFISSYRVRLREFRKQYRILFMLGMSLLLFSTLIIYMNKLLYLVIENPSKHFVYNNHVVQELSSQLKDMGVDAISTQDKRLQLRLKFYGIDEGREYRLYTHKPLADSKTVTIRYISVPVASFYVTNLYNR